MLVEEEELEPLFSVVRSLNVSGMGGTEPMPFLFLADAAGEVEWHREALVYAHASTAIANGRQTAARDLEAVARFHDFYRVFWHGRPIDPGTVDYLVCAYLVWRQKGTMEDGVSRLGRPAMEAVGCSSPEGRVQITNPLLPLLLDDLGTHQARAAAPHCLTQR